MPPKKATPAVKPTKPKTTPKSKTIKEVTQEPEQESKTQDPEDVDDDDLESELLEEFDEDIQELDVDPEEHQAPELDNEIKKDDDDEDDETPKKKLPQRRVVNLDTVGADDDDGDGDFGVEEDVDFDVEEDEEPTKNIKIVKFVPANKRKSSEVLGVKECARVLGDYAQVLDNGAPPLIDISNCTSSLEIAYLSLMQRRIPFSIIRYRNADEAEKWHLKEMTLNDIPPLDWFVPRAR